MKRVSNLLLAPFLAIILYSCQPSGGGQAGQPSSKDSLSASEAAITAIFAQDEELGAIRNQATEDTSLSFTIRQYVAEIDKLDFSHCPEDFTAAFGRHRDAWEKSIPFFSQFDTLRGEMHLLFEQIEQGGEVQGEAYREQLEHIMGTWAEVEAAANKHQALPGE